MATVTFEIPDPTVYTVTTEPVRWIPWWKRDERRKEKERAAEVTALRIRQEFEIAQSVAASQLKDSRAFLLMSIPKDDSEVLMKFSRLKDADRDILEAAVKALPKDVWI